MLLQQIADHTKLSPEDVQRIVGDKPLYGSADVDVIQEVLSLQKTKHLRSIEETLTYIQSASDEKAQETVEAMVARLLEAALPKYIGTNKAILEALHSNCDRLSSVYAKEIDHMLSQLTSQTLQKARWLSQQPRSSSKLSTAQLKEELWRNSFRKFLPTPIATVNRIKSVGNGHCSN